VCACVCVCVRVCVCAYVYVFSVCWHKDCGVVNRFVSHSSCRTHIRTAFSLLSTTSSTLSFSSTSFLLPSPSPHPSLLHTPLTNPLSPTFTLYPSPSASFPPAPTHFLSLPPPLPTKTKIILRWGIERNLRILEEQPAHDPVRLLTALHTLPGMCVCGRERDSFVTSKCVT